MEIKLKKALNDKNKNDIINILSFKYFDDFIHIKNMYNKSSNNSLFFDIKKLKKEFKLFLIGIFDILDLKTYLIHKDLKKNFFSLFEYDHENALKIKKRYFQLFNKDLEKEFKNENILKYTSYLLSDYFFPNIKKKDYLKLVNQLIKMDDNNNVDLNLIFYLFQLPNDILFNIIKCYEKEKKDTILNFIEKNFKSDIQGILKKRLTFMNSDILTQIQDTIKNKDSYSLIKIIINNKHNWYNIKQKYIKMYNSMDLNILDNDTLNLYNNIIEFNHHHILMKDIIPYINAYSVPYLHILNIDKMSFQKYIKSCYIIQGMECSKWADFIEKDLQNLDYFIFSLDQKDMEIKFSFKMTKSIAFLIKTIYIYHEYIKKYFCLFKGGNISIIHHKKIMEEISKKWEYHDFYVYHLFFPYNIENQIYQMKYYITLFTFLLDEKNPFKMYDKSIIEIWRKSLGQWYKFDEKTGASNKNWIVNKKTIFYITYKNKLINYNKYKNEN